MESSAPPAGLLAPSEALTQLVLPSASSVSSPPLPEQKVEEWYGFQVGDLGILFDTDVAQEVINAKKVSPVPKTPAWALGLMNHRGAVIPVFDLHLLLLGDEWLQGKQLRRLQLVVGSGLDSVAIPVFDMPESPDLERQLDTVPPVPSFLRKHVKAAYTTGAELWLNLDHNHLFAQMATLIGSRGE